jgi:hypothetical protein
VSSRKGTGGLLFVFCTEHGKLIGFQAMKFSESERTVFELVRTRFATAPPLIIYDNACNAARFCRVRDLPFFLQTRFIIDKLHVSNHRKCSPGFSPYVNCSAVRNINTSVCEQQNALYADKKKQFYFFAQDMYLFHLRLAVCLRHLKLEAAKEKKENIGAVRAAASRRKLEQSFDDDSTSDSSDSENGGDIRERNLQHDEVAVSDVEYD